MFCKKRLFGFCRVKELLEHEILVHKSGDGSGFELAAEVDRIPVTSDGRILKQVSAQSATAVFRLGEPRAAGARF